MGKKSSKQAPIPDSGQLIQQQTNANQISQYTPQGNLLYGSVDNSGNFAPRNSGTAVQVTETPFQEQLRGTTEDIALKLAGQINPQLPQITFDGLPPISSVNDIRSRVGSGNDVRDATFKKLTDLLNPQFDRSQGRLEQSLADQGLPQGSAAYSDAIGEFSRGKNAALSNAALEAILAGGQEENRLLGNEMQYGSLERSDRSRDLSERQAIRGQQFNEVASLYGLTPLPQFQNTPTVDAAGITMGLNNLAAQNAANQNAYRSSNISALGNLLGTGGLAAATLFASDRTLKENIQKVGKKNDFNLYSFNYKGSKEKYIGVMADEVEKSMPQAVSIINGYKAVDYSMIGIPFMQI